MMILMLCQPVPAYFMLEGYGIAFIVHSYSHFLCNHVLNVGEGLHKVLSMIKSRPFSSNYFYGKRISNLFFFIL